MARRSVPGLGLNRFGPVRVSASESPDERTRRVVECRAQQPAPELADQAKLDELTRREREVFELLARGTGARSGDS